MGEAQNPLRRVCKKRQTTQVKILLEKSFISKALAPMSGRTLVVLGGREKEENKPNLGGMGRERQTKSNTILG